MKNHSLSPPSKKIVGNEPSEKSDGFSFVTHYSLTYSLFAVRQIFTLRIRHIALHRIAASQFIG